MPFLRAKKYNALLCAFKMQLQWSCTERLKDRLLLLQSESVKVHNIRYLCRGELFYLGKVSAIE